MPSPFLADPGRYARRLRERLTRGPLGVSDPDFALERDEQIIEKIRRDPVIAKALNQRLSYTAACDWRLEAPDAPSRELVPWFEALLRRLERFADSRFNLARAIIEGMRWAKMLGRSAVVDLRHTGQPLRWWWVEQLADIDKRRLRLDWEPAATRESDAAPLLISGTDSPRRYFWRLFDPQSETWHRVDYPEHFIRHAAQTDEATLGYGRGLLESLYFYWRAKSALFGYMCDGAERFAHPWIVARIAPNSESNFDAALGAQYPTAEERADALISALEKMRRASILVLDQHDQVETIDLSGQGNALILDLVRYVDRCLVELILGASLPTGGVDGGSLARAVVERASTDDLLQFDREALEDTLTRDLIGALWRYNQPAFAALKLAHLSPPALRLGARPRQTPEHAIEIIRRCAEIKLPLPAAEVYDAIGFTPPADAPDVLRFD